MSPVTKEITAMLDMLPESEQELAYEFVKRLVRAWDSDFTKVTDAERERINHAEESGFISESDIDWDNLEKYND